MNHWITHVNIFEMRSDFPYPVFSLQNRFVSALMLFMNSWHENYIALFFLVALTLIIFGNTLFNQLTYDDVTVIVTNRFITSMRNFPRIFTKTYFRETPEKSYRPVVTATYFLDHALWRKRPVGYHLTNVLIHVLTVYLLFYFLMHFIRSREACFFAALLFAIHPVVCEAVNSISNREDLLAGLFVIAAFRTVFQKWILPVRLFFIFLFTSLALFSKESALPLILILPILKFVPQGESNSRQHHIPVLIWLSQTVALLFYLIIRFLIMVPENPMSTKVLGGSSVAAAAHCGYLFMLAWRYMLIPFPLNADYVFWHIRGIITPQSVAGFAFLVIYIVLIYILFKHRRYVSFFALMWILIFFLPVSNLIPLTNPFAERYLYLPLMGLSLLGGMAYEYFHARMFLKSPITFWKPNRIVGLVLIIFCAYLSVQRNLVWSTDRTLWSATLRREPSSIRALNGVALYYIWQDKYDKAEPLLKKACIIDPDDYEIRNNLAMVYVKTNRLREAETELRKALVLKPDYATAHFNLALLLNGFGEKEEAESHLQLAKRFGYPVPENFEW